MKLEIKNTFVSVASDFDPDSFFKAHSMPSCLPSAVFTSFGTCSNNNECFSRILSELQGELTRLPSSCPVPALQTSHGIDDWSSDSTTTELSSLPLDDQGVPTSIGSVNHQSGTCKPCAFYRHPNKVCTNGVDCQFCHFAHEPRKRKRKQSTKQAGA